ncbi:MAG TPA: PorV/PorQ family protein [Ignavibacteriaceae bacterium]|nr:PorV/PorQ family protein [Ignavibacteriaceae bacterium]
MKNLLLILSFLSVALQTAAFGQVTKTGTTAAKFLSIGIGARANAMGGAFTSISNDASALYWNPAGAAALDKFEAMFTYTALYKDLGINLNYAALVLPAGDYGNFGLSVTALDFGQMDVTTELFPEGTGEKFSAASYAFALSYARNITESFMAGITIKYISENIFNSSANGVAFDIGTIFVTPFAGIKFSTIINNYGSKMQISGEDLLIRYDSDPSRNGNNESVDAYYKTDKFELPLKLQIGLSKDVEFLDGQKFTLAVDATHPNDNSEYLNVGGELSLLDNLVFLRGGYKGLFLDDNQEGLTLGAGLSYTLGIFSIGFDYSYQQFEFLSYTHSFGLTLKF